MTAKISSQAKAIATAVAILLVQVQWVVAMHGYVSPVDITFPDWLTIVTNTLAAYGVTYMVPNGSAPAIQSAPAETLIDSH